MTRDVDRLTGRTFDLLVVGGGICGLIVAADAAQRGLSVALIERGDFGGGASSNHLRTIHGGLRYLQTLDFARARDAIRERRTLARIAPHAVRPMPFALPLSSRGLKSPPVMRFAFLLDQLVAYDRNHELPDALRLPVGRVLSRGRALDQFPLLAVQQASSFAIWYDYVTVEADRLTLTWALLAAAHSAELANYVSATALMIESRHIVGVRATDLNTGRSLEIAARMTVNATGGALDTLLAPAQASTATPMLLAINLVTSLPVGPVAIGGYTPSGRTVFMVPWHGKALFGTWESRTVHTAESPAPLDAAVAGFLADLQVAFPAIHPARSDVRLVHHAAVPATVTRSGEVHLEGQQRVHDHGFGAHVIQGLISVAGTKYSTARATAEYVTDRVLQKLGKSPVASRTGVVVLPGTDVASLASPDGHDGPPVPVSPEVRTSLMAAYGPGYDHVERFAERSRMGARLADDPPVVAAQVVWAVRNEMAMTLADVVRRRTALGATGHPGAQVAARVAQVMAAELGWSAERVKEELHSLDHAYEQDGSSPVPGHGGLGA